MHNNENLRKAYEILKQRLILQTSSSYVRKERQKLIVTLKDSARPLKDTWLVKGGRCEHTVTQMLPLEGTEARYILICLDHTPAHRPTKEGQACSHVSAVQLMLAKEIISNGR